MRESDQKQDVIRRMMSPYLDLPSGTVGVDVRAGGSSHLSNPDVEAMSAHVQEFLRRAGVRCEKAIPRGMGAAAGGPGLTTVEAVFQFMKPIGITIQAVKFLMAWHQRVTARKRRQLLPRVNVTLLASHIEPCRSGPDEWHDTASILVTLLPDLQRDLETEFPACCIRYTFNARGRKVTRFTLRAGEGLRVTDSHVLRMLKHLDRDVPALTLFHQEGWFAMPKVVRVDLVVRPLAIAPRAWTGM